MRLEAVPGRRSGRSRLISPTPGPSLPCSWPRSMAPPKRAEFRQQDHRDMSVSETTFALRIQRPWSGTGHRLLLAVSAVAVVAAGLAVLSWLLLAPGVAP